MVIIIKEYRLVVFPLSHTHTHTSQGPQCGQSIQQSVTTYTFLMRGNKPFRSIHFSSHSLLYHSMRASISRAVKTNSIYIYILSEEKYFFKQLFVCVCVVVVVRVFWMVFSGVVNCQCISRVFSLLTGPSQLNIKHAIMIALAVYIILTSVWILTNISDYCTFKKINGQL